MDFSELIHGFVKIDAWISRSFEMDLSKWSIWIFDLCFSCPVPNQTVWPGFQSLLKLQLWTKDVDWVEVLNALGPLCLWQCLFVATIYSIYANKMLGKIKKQVQKIWIQWFYLLKDYFGFFQAPTEGFFPLAQIIRSTFWGCLYVLNQAMSEWMNESIDQDSWSMLSLQLRDWCCFGWGTLRGLTRQD